MGDQDLWTSLQLARLAGNEEETGLAEGEPLVIQIQDTLSVGGQSLAVCLAIKFLQERPDFNLCFVVPDRRSVTSIENMAKKLGVNAAQRRLRFVEVEEEEDRAGEEIVEKIRELIQEEQGDEASGKKKKWCLVFSEGLSEMIHHAVTDYKHTQSFLSDFWNALPLLGLFTEGDKIDNHIGSIISVVNGLQPDDNLEANSFHDLVVLLAHQSHLVLSATPLSPGYSREINGKIDVTNGRLPDWKIPECFHYCISDTAGFRCFEPGTHR
eukprot:TRINITY_DN17866_c0_g1_i1.p1 TRINITY_DN17866_c0_g1~~TRINITY_DN17866_c0_g1_i1.p1  ORF type:complete len:276 (+),score=103.62 TRINITY_DN17866_c0_g1_i1:26-829(+)